MPLSDITDRYVTVKKDLDDPGIARELSFAVRASHSKRLHAALTLLAIAPRFCARHRHSPRTWSCHWIGTDARRRRSCH